MPTKPHPDIIPDYRNTPELVGILSRYASLIDETVNFGSHVFTWVFETAKKGDHHIAALSFYRRSLELLDSLSALIKNSCISPSRVLLRSLFEVLLSLEYMTQNDLENRGRDYILCLKHEELDYLKKFLKDDPLHAVYINKYKKDNLLKNAQIPEFPDIVKAIEAKARLIHSEFYSSSEASYQAIKLERKGRNPKWWFNLHNGPRDICDLAERMGRPAQYEVMYRNWARYAHGTGGMDEQVEIQQKDEIGIPQLRSPDGAEFIAFIALSYGLTIIQTVIRKYANEKMKGFSLWYKEEIQAGYLDLRTKRIIVK
jgi:hypothetical protein